MADPILGKCEICGEVYPLLKYKKGYYCKFHAQDLKDQELNKVEIKKVNKAKEDFSRLTSGGTNPGGFFG